jgi:hypothetical protein
MARGGRTPCVPRWVPGVTHGSRTRSANLPGEDSASSRREFGALGPAAGVLRPLGNRPGSVAGAVGGSKAADSGWAIVQNEANSGSNRAKRTQFCPAGERPTEGNHAKRSQTWGGWGMWGSAGCRAGRGLGVKRAKRTQFRPARAADGRNCAKRSQTWVDWGMWGKQLPRWPWPGRGVKRAKRTQFGPAGGG